MSMIARYKKKGGFQQLLQLMETCGPQKQEKFLKMIEDEDMRWAEAVRMKLITIKKVFSWNDDAVAEITAVLHDLTLGTAISGLDDIGKEKVHKSINHARKKKIEDTMAEKQPSSAEISTAFAQILTEVRKMIEDGLLSLDRVDPELIVRSDFEDMLLSGGPLLKMPSTPVEDLSVFESTEHSPTPATLHAEKGEKGETEHLRRIVSQITVENQKLKERLVIAESKLAQIKKIA